MNSLKLMLALFEMEYLHFLQLSHPMKENSLAFEAAERTHVILMGESTNVTCMKV